MQTESDTQSHSSKLEKRERVANILRLVSWLSLWIQLGFGVGAVLTLAFAVTGRIFNQAVTVTPGVGVDNLGTTPGLGIGNFWAICGIITLLVTVYLAFRQTRFARRLRNPDSALHPKKAEVLQVLRLGVILGLVGMLFSILGGGATLGVLLAKSISQPQALTTVVNPARFIRTIDIFVALANMNGITAHFVGTVACLGLYNWLHKE